MTPRNLSMRPAERALQRHWFPVSQTVKEQAQSYLASDICSGKKFLEIAKQDLGLFLYSLMKGGAYLKSKGEQGTLQLFKETLSPQFRELLSEGVAQLTTSSFAGMSKQQVEQSIHTVFAAAIAEELSKETSLDPDRCYTTAVLRNLGILICSWNYPATFSQSCERASDPKELQELLSQSLGFSPQLLALSIIQSWQFGDDIEAILDPSSIDLLSDERRASAKTLLQLCDIGEALATNCLFPERELPEGGLTRVITRVQGLLGKDFLHRLAHRVDDQLTIYRQQFPGNLDVTVENMLEKIEEKSRRYKIHNPHLKALPENARSIATEVYGSIQLGKASREQFQRVLKEIIPQTPFCAGAVYLVDPPHPQLLPRIGIADSTLRDFSPVHYVKQRGSTLVADAYWSQVPVRKIDGEKMGAIAGVLGDIQRLGVLILYFQLCSSEELPMSTFRAMQQLMSDCLGIF